MRIREALKTEPEWMQISFEIALHTVCRLREIRLPLNCVDFDNDAGAVAESLLLDSGQSKDGITAMLSWLSR